LDSLEFVVEHAGCSSCAGRIRGALQAVATVDSIEVDEAADAARVRLRGPAELSEETVGHVLREASLGSGHEYCVRPGSWRALA
jgi:copper chaperone CopZ